MKTYSLNLALAGLLVAGVSAQAITLDLTPGGSGVINGATFITVDQQSTGTGVIESFVRLAQSGNNTTAEGYNASARPVMPDVNTSPQFTHDINLSSVPVVTRSGVAYYEFLLDINQQSANSLLSLDKLQIYTRATALGTANTLAALTGSSTLRYDLDAGVDSKILLDYNLNSGSGSGDMFAYIPASLFGSTSDFVYLYSAFGFTGDPYSENDGFEEWAVRKSTTTNVPEGGATILLLGAAVTLLGAGRRFLKL